MYMCVVQQICCLASSRVEYSHSKLASHKMQADKEQFYNEYECENHMHSLDIERGRFAVDYERKIHERRGLF